MNLICCECSCLCSNTAALTGEPLGELLTPQENDSDAAEDVIWLVGVTLAQLEAMVSPSMPYAHKHLTYGLRFIKCCGRRKRRKTCTASLAPP